MRSESLQIWSSEITPPHALVLPNRIRESCLLNKWSCFHQQDVCHRPGVILRTPHSMQRWIFNFLSDFCHYFRLLGNKNVKKIFSDIPQCLSPRYSLSQFYSKNSSHYHVSWRGARGRRQYAKVGEEGLTSLLQLSFTSQYLFETISHSSHENQMLRKVNLGFICMAL